MKRRHAVLLLAVWVGLVAVSVSVARPPRSGPAVRPPAVSHPLSQARRPAHGGARHPYWALERRFVAQGHALGRANADRRRLRALLRQRDAATRRQRTLQRASSDPVAAQAQQVVVGLLCIHGGEGSWDDADSGHNGHRGGLQMDESFQANYAPPRLRALGTADHWTPLEQLAVGVIGWSLQGHWAPWPVTARNCGLR